MTIADLFGEDTLPSLAVPVSDDPDPAEVSAGDLLARCEAAGLTVSVAESLTGGMLAAALTAVPGSSRVFRGGVVTYATDTKVSVLGVPPQVIAEHGPVHSTTAAAMARHARMLFGADVGIATTGVAGPDPVGAYPPGAVFVAVDMHAGPARVVGLTMTGGREEVRAATVAAAIGLTAEVIHHR